MHVKHEESREESMHVKHEESRDMTIKEYLCLYTARQGMPV